MIEETAIHEAGHALVWEIESEYLGPVSFVSALPYAGATGCVRGVNGASKPLTLRRLRASGRMNAAEILAEALAGFVPPPPAAARDARNLALLEHLSKRGPRFTAECLAGAEFLLRMHWAGVERLASWLRTVGVIGPNATGLVRMALETPPRPLVPDDETLMRVFRDLEDVPELREQIAAALGSVSTAQ